MTEATNSPWRFQLYFLQAQFEAQLFGGTSADTDTGRYVGHAVRKQFLGPEDPGRSGATGGSLGLDPVAEY